MRENFEATWPSADAATPGWVRVPAPSPVPKTETIWHYTNTSGLIGILQSDRLWATAVSMLNDSTELRYGLEMAAVTYEEFTKVNELHDQQRRFLAEVYGRARSALRTNAIYAACASRDGDDLGQWRGYAEGSGYAVGLKSVGLSAVCASDQEPSAFVHRDLHMQWQEVMYDPQAQTKLLNDLWAFAATVAPRPGTEPGSSEWQVFLDTASAAVTNAVALMKHPGFRAEREVRFAFDSTRHRKHGMLRFRSGPHGVTPYVELGTMPEKSPQHLVTTPSPDRLSIAGIRVGPAQDMQTAELGLKSLLGTLGRTMSAALSHSEVPYR